MAHSSTHRRSLLPVLFAATVLIVAGCRSGEATPSHAADCQNWCGNGSATVTFQNVTTSIDLGGCFNGGSTGIDARFGDWLPDGTGNYITVSGYYQGIVPPPQPTPSPGSSLDTADHPNIAVSGSISGVDFVLDTTATVTFKRDGTGSFSGTDLNGGGTVSGYFSCQ